jgi:hypothetical protein
MAQFRNVCFTFNNPGPDPIPFDVEQMHYLVYQRERGENGTEHYQGYVELKKRLRLNQVKALLGSDTIHIEARRGTAQEASDYCKKDDSRMDGFEPVEFGEMKTTEPGKRNDLKEFKDAVMSGSKRKRDLVEEHFNVLARYPKFYDTLTMINRPKRTVDLTVTLLYGETGLGKTRKVMDLHGDDEELFVAPLNNGTMWYDTYDGHKKVLIDDFAGAASHISLTALLRLLDRYPVLVPTKGSHTWWLPDHIYITTNILPKDWYKWENREEQYKALARRFHRVEWYHVPLAGQSAMTEQGPEWWQENCPQGVHYY